MNSPLRVFETVEEAYLGVLHDVHHDYEYCPAPRGLPTREIINYQFTVLNPTAKCPRTKDAKRNRIMQKYFKKELALYESGTNRVEEFVKASKLWRQFANSDGTINSAYGYLVWHYASLGHSIFGNAQKITPWEWAKKCLVEDKETRQAFLRISLPEHQWFGNRNQPCTMHGQFLIRDDKLHLTMIMRANDVVRGLPYDMPWFILLMDKMVAELQETYPNLKKGFYTHFAHSMHMYEEDAEKVQKMLGE